ncbi:MAG: Rrf2 family transcriptional regulator [Patescibacteria group bacterium]
MAKFLSLRSDYGILLLLFLARQQDGEASSIAGISRHLNLSSAFLEQIAYRLRKAHFISAFRGRNGGYRLAQAPGLISLSSVIEALDGPIEAVSCQSTGCAVYPYCDTSHFWLFFQRYMHKTLREITLADLINKTPQELLPIGEKNYGRA